MPRTNEEHHGYGGDGASYCVPRAYCPECRADIPWPELPWLHQSAHRAERYSALAAEDAAHAEVVRAIDRDMHRNREA